MAKKSSERNRRERNLREVSVKNAGESKRGSRSRRENSDRDMREVLGEFLTSPAVKYIAGGLATAILGRLANNLSGRYPEISNFIRENMSTLEERYGDFKGNLGRENLSTRH